MIASVRSLALLAMSALLGACATAGVQVTQAPAASAQRFTTVAVEPFESGIGRDLPATAGEDVAGAVVAALQRDYRDRFSELYHEAKRQPGELIVRGKILAYDPGSKAARSILIGLGAGDLKLEVALVDGESGATLEQFSTDGAIVAGGLMGATMGIEDMIDSAADQIAKRIAPYGTGAAQTMR